MTNQKTSVVYVVSILSIILVGSEFSSAANWFEVNAGLNTFDVRYLAIDPLDETLVYAGTSDGLYRSTNGGMEWSNLGLKRVVSLAIDSVNPNTLYAGTEVFGRGGPALFKSTDGGSTWSNRASPSGFDFSLLVMDPTDSTTLYIGSLWQQSGSGSMFFKKTRDGGETWVEMEKSWDAGIVVGCCTFAIDASNPEIIYAPGHLYTGTSVTGSAVLKSTDGGASWRTTTFVSSFNSATNPYFVNLVAMDPQNSSTLYAATSGWGSGPGFPGLYKTSDGGNSWGAINTGLPTVGNHSRITAIVIDPDDTNVVYLATGGWAATHGQGVFKSIDGGKNWNAFNGGLDALNIRSLALAPGSPNVLYAGTFGGVFKSIDNKPIVTVNENGYCVGSPWKLTVSNSPAETPLRLVGTTNNQSWEVPDWRQTGRDGVWRETGIFAAEAEGTHHLRVEVGGVPSNVVSFVVSNCRP